MLSLLPRTGLAALACALLAGCLNAKRPATFAEACADGQVEHCRPEVCAEFEPDDLPEGCLQQADGDAVDTQDDVAVDAGQDTGPELPEPGDTGDEMSDVDATETKDIEDVGDLGDLGDSATEEVGPTDCTNLDGPCVVGAWDGTECVSQPTVGALCDDGNPCTLGDACQVDASCEGTLKVCTDGNPCTVDSCDTNTGLCQAEPEPDETLCDDGDSCTVEDACLLGVCSGFLSSYETTFGGAQDDEAHDAVVLADGGFAVIGTTTSKGAGETDAWLLRLDPHGNKIWEKTYGGEGDDPAYSIAADPSDGGFYVAGRYWTGAGYDAWLLKLDSSGAMLWEQKYDQAGFDEIRDMKVLPDGLVLVGRSTSQLLVVRAGADGSAVWSDIYTKNGGTSGAEAVVPLGDGTGFAIAGWLGNSLGTTTDMWLLALDDAGGQLWDEVYDGPSKSSATAVVPTTVGWALSGYASSSMWFSLTDAVGAQSSEKTYYSSLISSARDMVAVADGFVMAGYLQNGSASDRDAQLVKVDLAGEVAWQRSFGVGNDEEAAKVVPLEDGFLVVGYTMSKGSGGKDVWVLRTDSKGEIPCDTAN